MYRGIKKVIFSNTLEIRGASKESLQGFYEATLIETILTNFDNIFIAGEDWDKILIKEYESEWVPIEKDVIKLATQYIHLDFLLQFKCVTLEEIQGFMLIQDLEVFYTEDPEKVETQQVEESDHVGNVYKLNLQGGLNEEPNQ